MPHPDSPQHTCTAATPAPSGRQRNSVTHYWDPSWKHPDATGECINDDHDDWRYDCPHCKGVWIYEGPDA